MWAMGTIMAELFSLRPLFPGISEADEISKICGIIGTPTKESWLDGLNLARAINYQFSQSAGVYFSGLLPSASHDAVSLIRSCFYVPPFLRPRAAVCRTPPSVGTKGALDQQSGRMCSGAMANTKFANRFLPVKSNAMLSAGVQRKLDMVNEDVSKNDKPLEGPSRLPKYRPPGRKSPTSFSKEPMARGVSETAVKLANMSVESRKRWGVQLRAAPAMKTGVQF